MHLFFSRDIGEMTATLSEEEAHHCAQVLRLQPGQEALVTDGRGLMCRGVLEEVSRKKCTLRVLDRQEAYRQRPWKLHLAVAPTKQMDRIEWMLEKAMEIGLDTFTPILSRYTERKEVRTDRLEKIALAAMKQSQQAYLASVSPLTPFETFISQPWPGQKLIAHCQPGEKSPLLRNYQPHQDVLILIGPPGDFSVEEVQLAIQRGFQPISLGDTRLRTETAALMAVVGVHLVHGLQQP